MAPQREPLPAQAEPMLAATKATLDPAMAADTIERLADAQAETSARTINLNPAANVMNPRAEAMLARGFSTRPALGPPGAKHEAGVEALERMEATAIAMACRVFGAQHAEVRLASGTIANLCAYLALTRPGNTVIVPPPAIGGHASHLASGSAGLHGLRVVEAPVDAARYAIDLDRLAVLAATERPALIVAGGSLNLFPPDLAAFRAIADRTGALVLYDAAHIAGLVAGHAWPQPLADGAHLVTMSTYKSLGGPAGGLVLSDDSAIAAKIDRVAFPGLSANSDIGRAAALAVALGDSHVHGQAYAAAMIATARALAAALAGEGVPVFAAEHGFTASHQFAVDAETLGGAEPAVKRLAAAGLFASSIMLPGDTPGHPRGIRIGTPELARRGMTSADMPELARLIGAALLRSKAPHDLAPEVAALRRRLVGLHFILR